MTLRYRVERFFAICKELKRSKNLLTWFKKYPDDVDSHYVTAAATADMKAVLDDPTFFLNVKVESHKKLEDNSSLFTIEDAYVRNYAKPTIAHQRNRKLRDWLTKSN